MTRNLKITLGKTAVLCAAALFSAVALADTCPKVSEFKLEAQANGDPSHAHWVTDSGWKSQVVASDESRNHLNEYFFKKTYFDTYYANKIPNYIVVPNHVAGELAACEYSRYGQTGLNIVMRKPGFVIAAGNKEVNSIEGPWFPFINSGNGEPHDVYQCESKFLGACKFYLVPVDDNYPMHANKATAVSPFGK